MLIGLFTTVLVTVAVVRQTLTADTVKLRGTHNFTDELPEHI